MFATELETLHIDELLHTQTDIQEQMVESVFQSLPLYHYNKNSFTVNIHFFAF